MPGAENRGDGRESSDELATRASEILDANKPIITDAMIVDVVARLSVARGLDDQREALEIALRPLTDDLRSLAGSVMSQADGPE